MVGPGVLTQVGRGMQCGWSRWVAATDYTGLHFTFTTEHKKQNSQECQVAILFSTTSVSEFQKIETLS